MNEFKEKAQLWASSFSMASIMDSQGYADPYARFDWCICAGEKERFVSKNKGSFLQIQAFIDRHPQSFIPGFLSYELKDEVEDLESQLPDYTDFPLACFFIPRYRIIANGDTIWIDAAQAEQVLQEILSQDRTLPPFSFSGSIQQRMSEQEYKQTFSSVYQHLLRGDIYEMNLCQEFYAEQVDLHPLSTYQKLTSSSPTPFSSFFKLDDLYVISASPERFLQKKANVVLSQPIKGTAARFSDPEKDKASRMHLLNSEKERSENVMIVDLVRHDLTRSALPGTVQVKSLMEVQSFKQVHQLVSSITCQVSQDLPLSKLLQQTFPPGSMTGAPKKRAMELIEHFEKSRRGVYSGTLGYFYKGDFDFNVVIRSILYNAKNRYLSFQVGGAITVQSDADQEYQECLLKASAIINLLKGT